MKPMKPKSKKSHPTKRRTPAELVLGLLDLLLEGSDAGQASRAIVETRKVGLGPSDAKVQAWIERVARDRSASFDSLQTAIYNLDGEADDLFDALIAAAMREGSAPPVDEPWMEGLDWTEVSAEARWKFIELAVEDAADESQVSGMNDTARTRLSRYFEDVLPTLLPEPIDRLEWWIAHARNAARQRDTDLDFGMEVQGTAESWIGRAVDGELPSLLRLANLLQQPLWGALPDTRGWLEHVHERIRRALPEPKKRKGRPKGAGRQTSA